MPSKNTVVGDLAIQYLRDYPGYPLRTLARLMAKEEPKVFAGIEQARAALRWQAGQCGDKTRRRTHIAPDVLRDPGSQSDSLERLPEPIKEIDEWQIEKLDAKKILFLTDIHIPFHYKTVLLHALRHGESVGVDAVVLGGDTMDFYAASSFDKDPRIRNFPNEINMGREFLSVLREFFPKAQLVFMIGNHEERIFRYAVSRCPDLIGIKDKDENEILSMAHLLLTDNYGVRVIGERRPVLAGPHLYLVHGHEWGNSFVSPVNPARGLYLKAKVNAICGHLHQPSQHSEAGLDKVVSCWSTGCLCNLHPKYRPLNKWASGFAVIELDGDQWQVSNHKIINGSVV